MASNKELRALITLAGKVDPTLQSAMLKATNQTKKLSDQYNDTAKHASRLSDIIKGSFIGNLAASGVAYAVSQIKQLASGSLELASSLVEVQNVVDTTFKNNSVAINNFANTALEKFGLSELQAKQFSGTLGAMFKSSGIADGDLVRLSTDLAGLAGDMASFYNLDIDEAFTKIRSGISGETEPLKQLGINMSVANLEAYALARGIKTQYKDMSQAEQALLRYNYLMSTTTDQQGDFSKTSGEYANQQRVFRQNLQQSAATIASAFLPEINKLYKKGNEYMKNTDFKAIAASVSKGLQIAGKGVKFLADNADIVIPLLSGVVGGMMALKAMSIGTIFLGLSGPVALATLAIGGLIAMGVALYDKWDDIGRFFVNWGTSIKDGFAYAFNGIKSTVLTNLEVAKTGLKSFANFFIKIYNKIASGLNSFSVKIPNWVPEYGGNTFGFNIPTIPLFARGGIATRPSIFGEAGPEAAIPLKRTPRSYDLLYKTANILGLKGTENKSPKVIDRVEIHIHESNNPNITKQKIKEVFIELFGDLDDEGRLALE